MAMERYTSSKRDYEKVAHLLRSIVQDGALAYNKDIVDVIFKEKKINGVDIGEIARRWMNTLINYSESERGYQKDKIKMLAEEILYAYWDGINLDEDELFHELWIDNGLILFIEFRNRLPGTGKVGALGSLEKPSDTKKKEDKEFGW